MDGNPNNISERLTDVSQEKLELAQYFIKCYIAAREGLKKLGILRTERNLQGDYAEWLATEIMGLKLKPSAVHKAYDAVETTIRHLTYKVLIRILTI